jgi:uncharacterized protein YhdP
VRVGLVVLVLLGLAVLGLTLALPRLAASERVRLRVQEAAREATGHEVSWETLSFGLLPPRLLVEQARLYAAGQASQPSVAAERVGLRLALLPLLARSVVIDSLRVEGVTLNLVRTQEGIGLPIEVQPTEARGVEPAPSSPDGPTEGVPFALAVRKVTLRDSRIVLEDRAVQPPVTWELTDVGAQAEGRSMQAPLTVRLAASLASGGALRASGTAGLDGVVDLEAQLDAVTLEPANPYLAAGQSLRGRLSGTVRARGPAASPEQLVADLVLSEGEVSLGEVAVRGRVTLRATLEGGFGEPRGEFDVDATAAELAYGEVFTKPPGTQATATGRIVSEPDGTLGVDGVELRIRNFEGQGKLRLGQRSRLELTAPSFELQGWQELMPAVAPLEPAGSLALEGFELATQPLELGGRVELQALRLRPPGGEPITLGGELQGSGDALRGEQLRLVVAEQVFGLDFELAALADEPRYRLRLRTAGSDTNAVLSAISSLRDTLYGPLTLSSDLSGSLVAAKSPLKALQGSVRLEIGQGRFKGVSLLKGAFERLGSFGEAALLAGSLRGGTTLQRFYGDEFEAISGTFDLSGGFARTRDLRLVYRDYTVDLQGALGLADRSLDFSGTLTMEEEVDAALAEATAEQTSDPASAGRRKVIPLARVVGTLEQPRVDLSREAVVALTASYTLARRRDKLERKLDEKLGEGAGRQILDSFEDLFGSGGDPR